MSTEFIRMIGAGIFVYVAIYVAGELWIHRRTTPRGGWKAKNMIDRELFEQMNAEHQRTHIVKDWNVELNKVLDRFNVDENRKERNK